MRQPDIAWMLFFAAICLPAGTRALAADKNGVSPQTISLPSGPGSIQGLGESFQPQLNSGSGAYAVPIQLPKGPAGFAPSLSLQYHTGNGNGCLGMGWKLTGPTMVSRNMDGGLPLYVDAANGVDDDFDGIVDNPEEVDRFCGVDLEELVPLPDATFRSENEESFLRYERKAMGWMARSKGGLLHEFGTKSAARIENGGQIFAWLLDRTTDLNGNTIEFRYLSEPDSPGQKYCREIRWSGGTSFYAVVMHYEASRPDVHSDFRSGFEVRTGLRLARLDVMAQGVPASPGAVTGDLNEDGLPDSLIRRYVLEYEPKSLQSLLHRVTMLGTDGVTALPSVTFAYTEWEPPDNVSSSLVRSSGDPIAALDSENVEVIDMNRDGLPDLLQATPASHRVYLNLGVNEAGRLAWDTVGMLVANGPGLNLGSTSVHLADYSADGLADLVQRVNGATFLYFINTGEKSWLPPINLQYSDSWPRWPFENAGSRTLDADHNRLHDILFTSDNSYRLWMLFPGGRYGREVALPVLSDGTQAYSFENVGARIADLNGDRLSDLAWIQSTRVVCWASRGRGRFEGPLVLPLIGSLSAAEIGRSDFADVNGDGLADLIVVRPAASPNGILYRLNRGRAGFDARRTLFGLPAVQTGDATRCADMNGNGSVDLLISNSARPIGAREQFLDFVPGIRPQLLRRVDNGLGMVTTLEYETTIQQMLRARTAGRPWGSTMPISVPVVSRIIEEDSRGNEYTRELTYRDPYFDPVKQEFRGFAQTEIKEIGDSSAPTKISLHVFDTGISADCRKGKLLTQEVLDALGSRFDRVENSLRHRVLQQAADGREICFAFTEATDARVFEQTSDPAHIRTEYEYDDFGNVLRENKHGVADQDGDEIFVEKAYAYDPANWLMDRVSRSTTRDGQGALAAEDRFTYDDRGNLLEQHRWLNTASRYVVSMRNEYDALGNIVLVTDANDHRRSLAYDPLLHTYPITEVIHLESRDLYVTADYHLSLGTIASGIDFAGAQTFFEYDPLVRLTAILRPGGAETRCTYELGAPISRVITTVKEELGGGTFDSYAYFDGYGRGLGAKVEAEDGQWRFLDAVTFNNRKMEINHWLPYFTTINEYETPDAEMPYQSMSYDAKGRETETVNPDGTVARILFAPLIQHLFDENDTGDMARPATRRNDGLDRLVEVIERNGADKYVTRYVWNSLGDLLEIADAQGNKKRMVYDSLRRKISMNDPDRGMFVYEYDDVGNLLRTTDAKGQAIVYGYDFANRPVTENYLDRGGGPGDPIDVRLRYDIPSENVDFCDATSGTAALTGGRLSSVTDLSGEEHRSYDARGNVLWSVKRIRDPLLGVLTSYKTGFAYDLMDRMVEVHYPDNDRCSYSYDGGSFLERIDGSPSGRVIIGDASYEPTGQMSHVTFGNGVTTTYGYDSRDRLANLRTVSSRSGELIHYSYSYDPVSNITRIDDDRPLNLVPDSSPRRNTQLFRYDDLHRLTQVRYSSIGDGTPTHGQIDYAYDKIGNMLSQTCPSAGLPGHIPDHQVCLGTMNSGGSAGTHNRVGRMPGDAPGPHALTATEAGGVYEYDDNGNLTNLDAATLSWDFQDRLVRYEKGGVNAHYIYDYSDRRTAKLITQAGQTDQTLYINQYFEYRPNRAPVKYVFNGATRVAKVTDTLDSLRPRLQRIWMWEGWNPLTVAVETLQTAGELFGQDAVVYEWTGSEYRLVLASAIVPAGNPLWIEVGSARVVTAMGRYNPRTAPIAIPAGQTLLAWPKLEPFVPAEHLSKDTGRIHAYDSSQVRWFMSDRTLPDVLTDTLSFLPSATAFWLTSPNQTTLLPGATDDRGISYYHGDHLGSSNVITDNIGAILQENSFYPFGAPRHEYRPRQVEEPYRFTQKERDTESGLDYFGKRFYHSGIGRWLSTDPLEDNGGGLNLYAYVNHNPLKYQDPDGAEIKVTESSTGRGAQRTTTYEIHVKAVLIDGTSQRFSAKQVQDYADKLKATIEKSFSGQQGKFKWKTVVDLKVIDDATKIKKDDHVFRLIDRTKGSGRGEAAIGGMVMDIKANTLLEKRPNQIDPKDRHYEAYRRLYKSPEGTGAHEFGHSAGLDHAAGQNLMSWDREYDNADITLDQIKDIVKAYQTDQLNKRQ